MQQLAFSALHEKKNGPIVLNHLLDCFEKHHSTDTSSQLFIT